MVRNFTEAPVPAEVVDQLCDLARRAPSAGNTQATSFLVLDDAPGVARYWDVTIPVDRREGFRWPGLLAAPVLILVLVRPTAYVERYAEGDKAAAARPLGLGDEVGAWPVPYWWVDAGAAAEHLLLGAVDAGLGACLFGAFDHEAVVAETFCLPGDQRLVATIAMGHPAPSPLGRSADRPRRPLAEVIHRGQW